MDSRLQNAIATPKVQLHAGELIKLSLHALEDLKTLDESLYERFVATRNNPQSPEATAMAIYKLWDETFNGLLRTLAYARSIAPRRDMAATSDDVAFDFGDFVEAAPEPAGLDLGAGDISGLLETLDVVETNESERWAKVLEKVSSIEYGLSAQIKDARARLSVALSAGEMNQVLGILDDTQSQSSEGVHALVSVVYEEFIPDVTPATMVPGYLTSLGRALLVRRGLADLANKLAPPNTILQSDAVTAHPDALEHVRSIVRTFVASVVCRAMRAADRWQMVEFDSELNEQRPSVARLTAEGLVKYIDSLSSINQREVLVVHDQRTLAEMREALSSARQLVDLSPRTAREELERAYQAGQRLRGRHPATDDLIVSLDRFSSVSSNPSESVPFLEKLEALLAAAGG